MNRADVLIIGAGAAGLAASIFAAAADKRVIVLEKTPMAGRKILMSGGSRCNVLPVVAELSDYTTSSSPNLLRKIFKSWSVEACKRWFEEKIGLEMVTETHSNKWFPRSNSAKEVRDLLLAKAEKSGVIFHYRSEVQTIFRDDGNQWIVQTQDEKQYLAPKVILCSGGFSVPSTGTEGDGHRMLQEIGVSLHPTYPALTPLKGNHPGNENLAGISLDVGLHVQQTGKKPQQARRSGFLFTHRGFSGPAILDISHEVVQSYHGGASPEVRIDWSKQGKSYWEAQLLSGKGLVINRMKESLPERLSLALLTETGIPAHRTIAELSRKERLALLDALTQYPLVFNGHEGYKKAEVTGGGVPLEAIDTATMQLKAYPGLYVCGEIVDVFGRIGGFNFYWAWVSGRLAGMSS